jgi:FAD:protein FMN transferase
MVYDYSRPKMLVDRRTLLTRGPSLPQTWSAPADVWLRVHREAMACRFEVLLSGEDHPHTAAARDALAEADRLDAAWSIYRDDSAVTRLNRGAAAAPVVVDAELFALLVRARDLWQRSDGAFDITTTALSRCWGFIARDGRIPDAAAIDAARAIVGLDRVRLDGDARSVRFAIPGVEINLGAIGKGAAVDAVAARLVRAGVRHALVSAAGSSVVAVGGRDGGFAIEVTSPIVDRPLARLRLRCGALGTSGIGRQAVVHDGRRFGHVIDPRTGWPAGHDGSPQVISASVVASDAATADALSTAMLIGGSTLAARYCAEHPETLVLLTTDDLRTVRVGASRAALVEDPCI